MQLRTRRCCSAITHNLGELQADRALRTGERYVGRDGRRTHRRCPSFSRWRGCSRNETDLNVWRAMLGAFNYLDMIVDESDRPALAAEVRKIVGDAVARLGWEPKPGEDELTRQLRGTLIAVARHSRRRCRGRSQARSELYARYWDDDPSQADRDIAPALISILAYCRRRGALRRIQEQVQVRAHSAGRAALPVSRSRTSATRRCCARRWR